MAETQTQSLAEQLEGIGPSLPGSVITFDPDSLTARGAELEARMGEPGFWDDQQEAARISAEHARVTRKLETYKRLTGDYEAISELAGEDGADGDIAGLVAPLQRELAKLQEDALFSGEYDAGDALVTIHAGEGGTDAQDWAEMLVACTSAGPNVAGSRPRSSRRARGRRRA